MSLSKTPYPGPMHQSFVCTELSGWGGGPSLSLTDFKSSFTYFLQSVLMDHSKGTKISKEGGEVQVFLGDVGVGVGCGGPYT